MSRTRRALYRSRQVVNALWPRIAQRELEDALALLTEPERRLFAAMERRDQRHAIEVLGRVRTRSANHDLLVAALLHDCGKGEVPVWLRILHVAAPQFGRLAAKEGAPGWRGAAHRLRNHEALSEQLLREAGSSDLTLRLVTGTHTPEEAALARLLHEADDAS